MDYIVSLRLSDPLNAVVFDSQSCSSLAAVCDVQCLSKSGDVYSFGGNTTGQLGLDDYCNRSVPTRVVAINNHRVVQVAAGGGHSSALTVHGQVHMYAGFPSSLASTSTNAC